jgi:hypothetical protein
LGQNHKSFDLIGTFDDSNIEMRESFRNRLRKLRSLISAIGEERRQKWKHPEQRRHDEYATITILNVGRMNDGVKHEA